MQDAIELIHAEVRLTLKGNTLSLPIQEITHITAYLLNTRHETLTVIALLHESGHELEVRSDMKGWEAFLQDLTLLLSASLQAWQVHMQSLNEHNESMTLFTHKPSVN